LYHFTTNPDSLKQCQGYSEHTGCSLSQYSWYTIAGHSHNEEWRHLMDLWMQIN